MITGDAPTPFQRKVCWAGLTALAGLAVVAVILLAGWSVVSLCGYLKPVLTPIAIAALLAVPLTATLKVLLRRYFWDRPPAPPVQQTLKIEETIEKKTVAVELPL